MSGARRPGASLAAKDLAGARVGVCRVLHGVFVLGQLLGISWEPLGDHLETIWELLEHFLRTT